MIIKLIQSKSYSCGDITVFAKEPIITVNDKERAEYLLSTGYFEEIIEPNKENKNLNDNSVTKNDFLENSSEKSDDSDISKMKVNELNEMAINLGIDVSKKKTKADKVTAIVEFLDNKAE